MRCGKAVAASPSSLKQCCSPLLQCVADKMSRPSSMRFWSSANSGHHPSIRASNGQGFLRYFEGAEPIQRDLGTWPRPSGTTDTSPRNSCDFGSCASLERSAATPSASAPIRALSFCRGPCSGRKPPCFSTLKAMWQLSCAPASVWPWAAWCLAPASSDSRRTEVAGASGSPWWPHP